MEHLYPPPYRFQNGTSSPASRMEQSIDLILYHPRNLGCAPRPSLHAVIPRTSWGPCAAPTTHGRCSRYAHPARDIRRIRRRAWAGLMGASGGPRTRDRPASLSLEPARIRVGRSPHLARVCGPSPHPRTRGTFLPINGGVRAGARGPHPGKFFYFRYPCRYLSLAWCVTH